MLKYQTNLKLLTDCLNIPVTDWYKRKPRWTKKFLKLKEEKRYNIFYLHERFIEENKTFSINETLGSIWMETVFPIYDNLIFRLEGGYYDLYIANKEFLNKKIYKPNDCKIVTIGNFKFLKPKW